MPTDIISSRLEIIAAKARILSEKYNNGQFWEGELNRGLNEIEYEISQIRSGNSDRGWSPEDR